MKNILRSHHNFKFKFYYQSPNLALKEISEFFLSDSDPFLLSYFFFHRLFFSIQFSTLNYSMNNKNNQKSIDKSKEAENRTFILDTVLIFSWSWYTESILTTVSRKGRKLLLKIYYVDMPKKPPLTLNRVYGYHG